MRNVRVCALIALLLSPSSAAAQAWPGRVLIAVNAAMQTTSSTFTDDFSFRHAYSANIPGEEAFVDTRYEIPTGALFDAGVAVRLVGNLGVGVSMSLASGTSDIEVDARIPHPFLIAQHRQVEGEVAARHDQRGVHVQGVYRVPATPRLYFGLSGGPSYFSVEQRVVRTVSVREAFPFDAAEFASADLETLKESGWGFNAGVDVGWMFNTTFGIGGLLRYSKATISVAPAGRDARDVEAGGLHAGVGGRFAF